MINEYFLINTLIYFYFFHGLSIYEEKEEQEANGYLYCHFSVCFCFDGVTHAWG